MLINFNHLKTFGNAIIQKMKDFRSDWNQNDPTADDYIKNRTHYVEMGEAVILPLTTLNEGEVQLQQPLIKGQTYSITWDGVTYESVAREYDGVLMLGNNAIYAYDNGIETNTGEPFALEMEIGYNNAYIYINDDEMARHTISITTYGEIIHKLDKKYIDMPDGIITEESLYPILEHELAPVAFSNDYNSLSGKPTIYTDVVRYGTSQSLTDSQKSIARTNIGASNFSGNYNDLTEKPCYDLPTYETHASNSKGSWTTWTYSSSSGKAPSYRNVTLPRINLGETYRITTYSSSGVQTYSTECVAKLGYGINPDDNNLMLGNSTLWYGSGTNTGEPVLIYWHDETSENVTIFIDFGVITGGASRIDIHKRVDTLKQLDEKFIPDSVKYGNTEATHTYTWDGDITGKQRASSFSGARYYYKVADIGFNVNSIVNTECILSSNTNSPVALYTADESYVTYDLIISNHTGAFPVYEDSSGGSVRVIINVPEPGIYMCYDDINDEYVKSASITYNARAIPSDVVGVVRTINGIAPDVDGNVKYLPDWNASENENGYIQNRTHYDYLTTIEQPFTIVSSAGEQIIDIKNVSPENTTDLRIGHIPFNTEYIEKGATYFVYEDSTIKIRITFVEGDNGQCDAHWLLTPTSTYSAIAYHTFKEVHQLDKKYLPDDHINSLIDTKLGVIENGSY